MTTRTKKPKKMKTENNWACVDIETGTLRISYKAERLARMALYKGERIARVEIREVAK